MNKTKIKSIEDLDKVQNVILNKLVVGNLAYFSLTVIDTTGYSSCFFTPTSEIRKEKKTMIFVNDYEKILMLLLSHPNIKDIEYDGEENAISAIFDNPMKEEYESRWTSEVEEY